MKEDMRVIKWILLSCRYAQQGVELKLRCPREIGGDVELAFKLSHHARFGMRMGRTRVLHRAPSRVPDFVESVLGRDRLFYP